MSLYNLLNGVRSATFFALPMLDLHPDSIPRFRDCFLSDEEHPEIQDRILVYTRVGGNNRNEGFGEEELMKHPNYESTYDDSEDNTYGMYVFTIPEKWKDQMQFVRSGQLWKFSDDYVNQMKKVYPKLSDKFDEIIKLSKEKYGDTNIGTGEREEEKS